MSTRQNLLRWICAKDEEAVVWIMGMGPVSSIQLEQQKR